MTLEVSDVRILADGIVKVIYSGLGIGIEFANITDEYRSCLMNSWLLARVVD